MIAGVQKWDARFSGRDTKILNPGITVGHWKKKVKFQIMITTSGVAKGKGAQGVQTPQIDATTFSFQSNNEW